ncbi:hypothetical protein ACOMHN_009731 [Nucella lapillus]
MPTDKGREAEEERFGENKGGRNAEGLHYADLDLVRKPAPAPRRPIENARPGATSISGSVTTAPVSDTTPTEYASIRLY